MIVLDASALIHLLGGGPIGRRIAERVVDESLTAPHLVDLETSQVIRRLLLAGRIEESRAEAMIDALAALDIERYPHDVLLGRIWTLRHNLTAYDAAYVALAEVLGCPLVTCDRRLARTAGFLIGIELFEEREDRDA